MDVGRSSVGFSVECNSTDVEFSSPVLARMDKVHEENIKELYLAVFKTLAAISPRLATRSVLRESILE